MMRKILGIVLVALMCAFAGIGFSRERMKTIWDFREELSLSREQEGRIREQLRHFEKELVRLHARQRVVEQEIQTLVEQNASQEALRGKLRESAEIQVEIRLEDILTARQIRQILTPEQLNRWKKIQRDLLKKKAANGSNPNHVR